MIIQSTSSFFAAAGTAGSPSARQNSTTSAANSADTATISDAAWKALAASNTSSSSTSTAANVYQGKSPDKLTAEELDREQKAGGFVNTMANLSPAEKALYDKAIASGNSEAAAGISRIAFVRTMGHTAGGANGSTYDPLNTEITAANIEKYFSYSIVDSSGKDQSHFQALIQYLQDHPVA